MDASQNLYTDRTHLTSAAYGTSGNLMARKAIYQFQQPQINFAEWALDLIDWQHVARVVDVGCGNGTWLRELGARERLHVLGFDLSRGMAREAAGGWSDHARRLVGVADVQNLPLANTSCDLALAIHMLYHVPDIMAGARELRRVLRPGGVLLAATNGRDHLREMSALLYKAVSEATGTSFSQDNQLSDRFSLENGADMLRGSFAYVERHDVRGELVIPQAEPVVQYLGSMKSTIMSTFPHDLDWPAVMRVVERRVGEAVRQHGAFHVQTHAGLFLCR